MIGASKILTVSYGTFSCTLEGFDDPFNTMKAIAEYFRDLAAEDRYFGAEPPTPDAAMLHKIAEREVQRRVEARVQDNGVILRAADADDRMPEVNAEHWMPEANAEHMMPEASADTWAPEMEADVAPAAAIALVAEMDSGPDDDAPLPALNPMPDGVAARLAKIRAAVALAEPEVAAPVAVSFSDFTEDQHADEAFAPFDVVDDAAETIVVPTAFDETDDLADDLIADLAALDGAAPEDLAADVESEAVSDEADDMMLSNLAAMDAPVEDGAVDDVSSATMVEDEPAVLADIMADDTEATDDALRDALIEEADDQWSAADEMPAEMMIGDDLDDVAEDDAVAELPAEIMIGADLDDLPADEAVADEAAVEVADEAVADEAAVEVADEAVVELAEKALADEVTVEVADKAVADDLATELEAEPEAPAPEAPAIDGAAVLERAQRARARVIRVRRSAEIAIERTAPQAPVMDEVAAPLADDAEAELQRELDAIEAEAGAVQAAVEDADDDLRRQLSGMMDSAEQTDREPARNGAVASGDSALDAGVEEDAVRRLMDQTQSEMAVPENRRRLSSIAHLKAAVAATIAERFGMKPKPVEEVEATRAEPYRADLALTVRPGQPSGTTGAGDRPAPLVLVSAQRIDRPAAPVAVTPVRPRRITAQTAAALQPAFEDEFDTEIEADADNIFGDAKGFAEFADRVGANDLPELLEAAAAYGAAVEGRDSFTRPQLLRQIADVAGDDVTREDGLRGFGALLRDGRIVKVKRGEFALTETSSYLAEARRIAG